MELSAGFRRVPRRDLDDAGEEAELAARIRSEIQATGPITFARFMELALYDSNGGYYRASESRPGRAGDFLTSPEAHPIFGRALARQLIEIWERLGRPGRFVLQEHGAGAGALAESVLGGLRAEASALADVLRYRPVEIEPRRLESLAARLTAAGLSDVLEPAGDEPITGVVFANEVLDALPVHRVGVRDGVLLERFVAVNPATGDLEDAWSAPSTPAIAARLDAEGVRLAEGQVAEVGLAVDGWIAAAAAGLTRGVLLLIDYGEPAGRLYDPTRRPHGTVRAYLRHRVHDELYRHVGRQDLTAHVDLTAVEAAALRAGLTTVGSTSQTAFLAGNGIEMLLREVQADPATTLGSYVELRSALMRLIDPAAMGGFRVLAFGRDWPGGPALSGFAYRVPSRTVHSSAPDYG